MANLISPKFSFGIVSSRGFFEKLEAEYDDFDKNHISARHAINCALTSWHLTDWIFHEYFFNDPKYVDQQKTKKVKGVLTTITISGLTIFQSYMLKKCPALKYMKLVGNGSKHCIVRDSTLEGKTIVHEGGFSALDFDRNDFDVDRFEIHIGKTIIDFEDELIKTISFYKNFIEELEAK